VRQRPKILPWVYRWRTNLIHMPVFGLMTAICGSLALLASLFDKKGNLQHRIARIWAKGSVWNTWSKLTVTGAENLHKQPVAVYASNHTSYMDIPVIFSSLPFQFRIFAKKELWSIPFIGWYLNRSGQISIDTRNPSAARSSLGAGAKALRSGMALVVFPEGSRTKDGKLQFFQSGAAFLAIRTQVPLVPMALSGVFELLPIHTHHFYPSELTLRIGEPIETTGMTLRQTDELTARLREAIEKLLESEDTEAESPVEAESVSSKR
jgi:1-acyl-sn-glycerol-3-phosphate acyltransferase